MSITLVTKPRSSNEASKHDCWVKAMKKEINALEANNTWVISDLPPNKYHWLSLGVQD